MDLLISLIMRKPSFLKKFLISLFIIIAIEIIQFVTYLGIADVDDVILNITGCVIGHLAYIIVAKFQIFKIKSNKQMETT